jgi:hypothetical protein
MLMPLKYLVNENRARVFCMLLLLALGPLAFQLLFGRASPYIVNKGLSSPPGSQIKRSVSAATCTNLRPLKLSALTIHLFRFFLFFLQFLSSSSSVGICIASWASGKGSSDFLSPFLLVLFGIFPSTFATFSSTILSFFVSFCKLFLLSLPISLGLIHLHCDLCADLESLLRSASKPIPQQPPREPCWKESTSRPSGEHCLGYSAPPDPRSRLGFGTSIQPKPV